MVVVKIGGSLYDHPRLGPGLRDYVTGLAPVPVLFVPGGGPAADAVRVWDRVHGLGEEASHDLALVSLRTTAALLRVFLPEAEFARHPAMPVTGIRVLDCHTFCQLDGTLPHTWDVTSDSIAARAAVVYGAERLVLLKSADIPPGTPWEAAAERGWVDRHFPHAVAARGLRVEAINFRARLDARG